MDRLIHMRRFPAVVHPRHAWALRDEDDPAALTAWVGGYAITVPEHRRLVEDLLDAFAWQGHGQATLVSGRYGTGKSHLLVLLHLLLAVPAAWPAFLAAHPTYRRFAAPLSERRWLVAHCSLDAYGTRQSVEAVLLREVRAAMATAGVTVPAEDGSSRAETWATLLDASQQGGYAGLVLLVDELSLFLAGRSPARREADAAFLQFLAGWTARAPLWLVGALQRNLSDVGGLRTHSWRQVEDRFRRYSLCPQQLGDVLREKVVERTDPAAARAIVAAQILPVTRAVGLAPEAVQAHWPFHPAALELLLAVVNAHGSPHRGAVEVLQQLPATGLLDRGAARLLTPLDLFGLVEDDLRADARHARLWAAVAHLAACAAEAPHPALAGDAVRLLALLHLADHPATVGQMCALLCDGIGAPTAAALGAVLHYLRRHGAYLAVVREADPGAERFSLALEDEAGVLAWSHMQEVRHALTPGDSRVIDDVLAACLDPGWPLAATAEGVTLHVPWCGTERPVLVTQAPVVSEERVLRGYEGLLAGQADGLVLLCRPGCGELAPWHRAAARCAEPHAGVLLLWQPRPATREDAALWAEYAAWHRAAEDPNPPAGPTDRRARARCRERAEELRPAVAASVRALYADGQWWAASGEEGSPAGADTLTEALAAMLAGGFARRYPAFPPLAPHGAPTRAAAQQLLAAFIEPGSAPLGAQSLLADYLTRYALPLGLAEVVDGTARLLPPAAELLAPLLPVLAAGPAREPELLRALGHPPLGLPPELARLVLAAALRTGTLLPLDGFLQPLDAETLPLARADAVAFVGLPAEVERRHLPQVAALADHWGLPEGPSPLRGSQVGQRLRAWVRLWAPRVVPMREAIADWSATLEVLPWGWREADGHLTALERAAEMTETAALLDALGPEASARMTGLDTLWRGLAWWQAWRQRLAVLVALPEAAALREHLAVGEGCLPALPALETLATRLWADYHDRYHRWHEALFGAEVIQALREVFSSPDFQGIKLLARLPVVPPDAAVRCLEALACARAVYCPGRLATLAEEGVCAGCRLPLGSASPLPDPAAVQRLAQEGLAAYVSLLASSPWAADMRARLPRAPEEIATRLRALLDWTPTAGAAQLATLVDDRVVAWLHRGEPARDTRQLAQLAARLAGRDLTVGEARATVAAWLDPEGTLDENALLAFE